MKRVVRFIQDFPEVKLVGRKIGPFSEGSQVRLRPWEASVLEEQGLVKFEEDFSHIGIRKLLIAEEKSQQLGDLPSSFYLTVSSEFSRLRRKGDIERAEELKENVESLVSLRIQKLAKMAVCSNIPRDLPPEEIHLLNEISKDLRLWKNRLDRLFEESPNEEVGAHGKQIRRSVQRIVRDAADIQE